MADGRGSLPFDFVADEDVVQRNEMSQFVEAMNIVNLAVELGT